MDQDDIAHGHLHEMEFSDDNTYFCGLGILLGISSLYKFCAKSIAQITSYNIFMLCFLANSNIIIPININVKSKVQPCCSLFIIDYIVVLFL